jgi:hypothetical protein
MKLEASQRLRASQELEALLTKPARAGSQRALLTNIANMVVGDRPVARTSCSTVAKYLMHKPSAGGTILLLGHANSKDPVHCIIIDPMGQIVADLFRGGMKDKQYYFTTNEGEQIVTTILAEVPVKQFMHNLVNNTFGSWVEQYPN